jgi:hypothetical protein
LFDPETANGLNLSTVSFRDTEAFTDIPRGERRAADLVAQVETRDGAPKLVLVHVEIQREREAHFARRMWQYYVVLRQRENKPVIPMALVLYPTGEGIGLEEYAEDVLGRTYLTFRYLQISLPLLPAQEYVEAQSPLGAGLASLMRLPAGDRRAQVALHLACLRRIRQAQETGEIDEARTFLLVNMVATYLPLSDDERQALQVQLQQEGDPTLEATELTWADQVFLRGRQEGREEGRQEGRQEGTVLAMREAIRRVVRARFGSVPPALESALQAMTREEELAALFDRGLKAQAVDELV